jgi:hypothetical protein
VQKVCSIDYDDVNQDQATCGGFSSSCLGQVQRVEARFGFRDFSGVCEEIAMDDANEWFSDFLDADSFASRLGLPATGPRCRSCGNGGV